MAQDRNTAATPLTRRTVTTVHEVWHGPGHAAWKPGSTVSLPEDHAVELLAAGHALDPHAALPTQDEVATEADERA